MKLRMHGLIRITSSIIAAVVLAASVSGASPTTNVSTLAGSGLSGNADGPAPQAQFVMPAGLAEDPLGNLYIADAGGQRVRELTRDGAVVTVAGSGDLMPSRLWVRGGYEDGAAALARFNHPAGIAVASDGSIFVADTLNHCIRKIAHQQVTTFAGRPPFSGEEDGARAVASFRNPRALAFSDDGLLYVADYGVGLRQISQEGNVRTIPLPRTVDRRIAGLSIWDAGSRRVFFVSTWNALVKLDSDFHPAWIQRITPPKAGPTLFDEIGRLRVATIRESLRALGHPFAVAALDADSIVYTDLHAHSIGYFAKRGARSEAAILSAWPKPDAANRAGGYRDGALSSASFNAPLSVLRRLDGTIAVADGGNRRIRAFAYDATDRLQKAPRPPRIARMDSPGSGEIDVRVQIAPHLSSRYYRIAFLGNSYGYWDTRWNESLERLVEKRLNEDRTHIGLQKPVKAVLLFPYFETLDSVVGYAQEILSEHNFDTVIWLVNQQTVALQYARVLAAEPLTYSPQQTGEAFARFWQPRLTAAMRKVKHTFDRSGVSFFVALHPIGLELTPLEDAELEEFQEPFYPTNSYSLWSQSGMGMQLRAAVSSAGASLIDSYPQFVRAELSAFRVPLYGTLDEHFSKAGRTLLANVIADKLEDVRPWARHASARRAARVLPRASYPAAARKSRTPTVCPESDGSRAPRSDPSSTTRCGHTT